ncbi:uncharacterized protein LOC126092901 [Schistocerca cancellata]|uniref:uncharacterized protein LOC126092901 n=1 Tax=Schistocerca cancellata TaxID=274614 RepID=UPI002117B86D|nr:uncharacterized protein LOC126092901 [Schistocerca cancellata]
MYLIIVDGHSKWPEVIKMLSTNTSALGDALIPFFVQFGQLKVILPDNGPQLHAPKASMFDETSDIDKLNIWLLTYQNAEHTFTGQSTAMLMFGKDIRTQLSLTKSCDIQPKIRPKLIPEKSCTFSVGDFLCMRNGVWGKGIVLKRGRNGMHIVKYLNVPILDDDVADFISCSETNNIPESQP